MTNNEHASLNKNEQNNALDNSNNEVHDSEASDLEETTRSLINVEHGKTKPVEADNTSEAADTISVAEDSTLEAETTAMMQSETGDSTATDTVGVNSGGAVTAGTGETRNSEEDTPEAGEETSEKGKKRKRKVLIASVAAAVAVLVAVGGGLGHYRYHTVAEQKKACTTTVNVIKKEQQSLATLLGSDDVTKALKVTESQVLKADAHVISDLKDAVEQAGHKVGVPSCELDYWDFTTNLDQQTSAVSKLVAQRQTAVTSAVESVQDALSAKKLADAKTKLQTTVDTASKLLTDSDGKVADNATRDALKKAIDAAKKLLKEGKETDPAKYVTKALDDAVNGVNASVEAKRKADEEAAAQAAAEAAAAAAAQAQRSYTPSYTGGGYAGGGYSGGNGGGSYTPPANNNSSGGYAGGLGQGYGIQPGDGSEGLPDYGIIYH